MPMSLPSSSMTGTFLNLFFASTSAISPMVWSAVAHSTRCTASSMTLRRLSARAFSSKDSLSYSTMLEYPPPKMERVFCAATAFMMSPSLINPTTWRSSSITTSPLVPSSLNRATTSPRSWS